MDEYIEQKALVELIDERNRNTCNGAISCLQMKQMVKAIPTADVAPVRHGRWVQIHCHIESIDGVEDRIDEYCSACHSPNGREKSNYCPNCGAKMDVKVRTMEEHSQSSYDGVQFRCVACHGQLPWRCVFCPSCGKKLTEIASPIEMQLDGRRE